MTRLGATEAKALARGEFDDKGRRLEDRRRLETVVVLAVNDADAVVPFFYGDAEEKSSRALGRVRAQARNLKEIDGRTPQGVECAA